MNEVFLTVATVAQSTPSVPLLPDGKKTSGYLLSSTHPYSGVVFSRELHISFGTTTVYMLVLLSHNLQQNLRYAGDPNST